MDFALRLGITRSRLCNYINDRSEPDYATLCTIAEALQVSVDYLLGRNGIQDSDFQGSRIFSDFIIGREKPASEGMTVWIPLYLSRSETLEEPPVPSGWLRETSSFVQTGEFRQPYAIIVGDDSMAPEIMPGDIAYIQPCFIYHPFMEQNLGRDLFGVRLDAGDAVGTSLKRCCVQSNLLIFYSNNVKYSPVILDMNKILFVPLIGKVVSIWRSYLDSDMLEMYYPGLGDIPAKQLLAKAPVMSYAVSEYVFLQADSEQDAAQAVKILQTRIDSQADGDAFYPETIDQWKAAKVLQNGAYVAMIASGEHQTEIEDAWNAQFGA